MGGRRERRGVEWRGGQATRRGAPSTSTLPEPCLKAVTKRPGEGGGGVIDVVMAVPTVHSFQCLRDPRSEGVVTRFTFKIPMPRLAERSLSSRSLFALPPFPPPSFGPVEITITQLPLRPRPRAPHSGS